MQTTIQATADETAQESIAEARRLPYLPALDGLRAIAVAAVLAYHGGLALYGGFLGVETFFVLSGFLITALLVTEWRATGRIDLALFWRRRALRLLPALILLLVVTLAIGVLLMPGESAGLGGDALAALAYVINWQLIWSERSYFDATLRPPLLQHLWSLAVEEQFYVLWPLLFVGGMRLLRARGLLFATIATAGASVFLMARLYDPGADSSRIYYGTDTRVAGLLLGSALAMVWLPGHLPAPQSRRLGIVLDLIGLAALASLIGAYVVVFASHPLLYRGGFALTALMTCLLLVAATHPQTRMLPRLLGWTPLRWLGQRSYGIYLWHWPVFALSRPAVDIPVSGWWVEVLRFGLAIGLAALSYRFVEMPIRRGALSHAWTSLRAIRFSELPLTRLVCHVRDRGRTAEAWTGAFSVFLILSAMLLLSTSLYLTRNAPLLSAASEYIPTLTPAASQPILNQTHMTEIRPSTASSEAQQDVPLFGEASDAAVGPATVTPTTFLGEDVNRTSVKPSLARELQAIIDAAVVDESIPGVVAAVRIPGQDPWVSAAGFANRETDELMTPDTQVRIGSVSKMFTAVVVLQLVEEGQVELDAPIAQWFPNLVPNADQITVRHLLQHRSGLYDYLEDRYFVAITYQEPERIWQPSELVEYAADFPFAFEPGTEGAWDYSSTNYVILGMLVERITGNSLAAEAEARIFEPLGLKQTMFTPGEVIVGPLATGYTQRVAQSDASMSFVVGTASIVSKMGDLQRFAAALFGGELIEPHTMEQFQQFVDGKGQYNMPELAYGLGVMRNQLPVGHGSEGNERATALTTVLGHIGGFRGFRSALWYNPETGIIVTLGVNQASIDPNELAAALYDAALSNIEQ